MKKLRKQLKGIVFIVTMLLFLTGCGKSTKTSQELDIQKQTEENNNIEEGESTENTKTNIQENKSEEESTTGEDVQKEQESESSSTEQSTSGRIIAIDPGHQLKGNSEQEPIGPGAAETKAKASSGTSGCVTGLNEYELNLTVSLKLKEELFQRGYEIVMIRETHDVDLSNSERAAIANNSGADIFVRIHANSGNDSSVSGILTVCPTANNSYVGNLYSQCKDLSTSLVDNMVATTGAVNRGVLELDNMSGINWCQIPVTIVEMGFMSNPAEDQLLADDSYQNKIVQGIANGIDEYFESY